MKPDVRMADLLALSVDERLRLVQDLWDSIAEVPDAIELTESQRVELERRLADYRAGVSTTAPWASVLARFGV